MRTTESLIDGYLEALGLDRRDQRIYRAVAMLGVQPASVIAKECRMDRVTTYKHLKKLAAMGLIQTYFTHAIQHFRIEDPSALQRRVREKEQEAHALLASFSDVEREIRRLQQMQQDVPSVQMFEGEHGMMSCMRDILFEAKEQGILQVRLLSTNTFSERLGRIALGVYLKPLLEAARERRVHLDLLEATGTLLPERIEHRAVEGVDLRNLPAANGATHIFLVGSAVYLLTFRQTPIALKIKQREMAQMFHFLFDMARPARKKTIIRETPVPTPRVPTRSKVRRGRSSSE